MRSDEEMMDMILSFARNDERVRVVTMEGSRLNKNAPRDTFQDYDISYIVGDLGSFKKNDDWLDVFGKRIIMQKPEAMAMFPPTLGNWFSYLMLYEDGNRIDLKLIPINELDLYFTKCDSLTKVLLDKDHRCPELPEPSDIDYHVKKPSPEFVDDCSNEFWWLAAYVVKGLCRDEPLYAIYHLQLMQKQLLCMISWKTGMETGYSVSVGKSYKYLQKYLSGELWERILATYQVNSPALLGQALKTCCKLFQEISGEVSAGLGYPRPGYGEKVLAYLERFI
ncbi:MAG: aminoglycoside 6-adenylyltransferase [Treponema sp.]|jgi:aminoglycoside 6-adenylyltransferase|nr:aminoglycoside 6-adenylyltransferase [Treponema sp.]